MWKCENVEMWKCANDQLENLVVPGLTIDIEYLHIFTSSHLPAGRFAHFHIFTFAHFHISTLFLSFLLPPPVGEEIAFFQFFHIAQFPFQCFGALGDFDE